MSEQSQATLTAPEASPSTTPTAERTTAERLRERDSLFDSIAQEKEEGIRSPQQTQMAKVFTGLLWTGYAIAIAVAGVLVWTAANGLLQSMSFR